MKRTLPLYYTQGNPRRIRFFIELVSNSENFLNSVQIPYWTRFQFRKLSEFSPDFLLDSFSIQKTFRIQSRFLIGLVSNLENFPNSVQILQFRKLSLSSTFSTSSLFLQLHVLIRSPINIHIFRISSHLIFQVGFGSACWGHLCLYVLKIISASNNI